MRQKKHVLQVNRHFYDIFALLDILEMPRLWRRCEEVVCVHPAWVTCMENICSIDEKIQAQARMVGLNIFVWFHEQWKMQAHYGSLLASVPLDLTQGEG